MFSKVMIANRGEIACRIIRTCQRLSIRTLAVYSDADEGALHTRLADEAFYIGPSPARESYLDQEKLIKIAREEQVQAIHPGYGFLSENADFAAACEKAGIIFIGPPPSAIEAMGLKDQAKILMEKAGVPVVPGYHGDNQDPAFLASEASRIHYPVLIKARAGGGGKGMRKVEAPADFSQALDSARREAAASFGDTHVLLERWIETPRHIEVQIFADQQGNVVHLYERDCSLQRRHQKVIEEAPAPGIDPATRTAMTTAAINAAKAIGYVGAGTVEFIAEGGVKKLHSQGFWFMEMNTRLQVEHPVTEAITGIDLVEWQLRIAAGESLPLKQADIPLNGAAMEARIYAEDPAQDFIPQPGHLTYIDFPASHDQTVRIDSGVQSGDEITPYYDPMIAKVIASGSTRTQAINRLRQALGEIYINGLTTNLSFLHRLLGQKDFHKATMDTGLIDRALEELIEPSPASPAIQAAAGLLLSGALVTETTRTETMQAQNTQRDSWNQLPGFRLWTSDALPVSLVEKIERAENPLTLYIVPHIASGGGNLFDVTVTPDATPLCVKYLPDQTPHGHTTHETRQNEAYNATLCLSIDGKISHLNYRRTDDEVVIYHNAQNFLYRRADRLDGADDSTAGTGDDVRSLMPGAIRLVAVKPGDYVEKGAVLIGMEAMKMEQILEAPRAGEIDSVTVKVGDQVAAGDILVTFAPSKVSS